MSSARIAAAAAVVAVLLLLQCASAAPAADRVTSLPGYPSDAPALSLYSGYLTALNDSYLHYMLVEAIDVDPATAPLILFTSGGPGCSSELAFGYELGPVHFAAFNSSGPVMQYNPYTWARIANVAFLDMPPGVGFSWSVSGNYTITDTQNAANNFAALRYLLTEKFPEYAQSPLVLSGESYSGIYTTTLANEVLNWNANANATDRINLRGVAVGNGVTDGDYDDNFVLSTLAMAASHALVSPEFAARATRDCVANPNGAACNADQGEFFEETALINVYNIFDHCFQLPELRWKYLPQARRRLQHIADREFGGDVDAAIAAAQRKLWAAPPPSPSGGDAPCVDTRTLDTYMNRADVKAALHVQPSLTYRTCYSINYVSNVWSVTDIYNRLMTEGVAVMFYSGNIDMSVPYTGTQGWIEAQNWATTRPFATWVFNDTSYPYGPQIGGFATKYSNGGASDFWFVRVHRSGHMVPQFTPASAFEMISRFLSGTGF